MTFVLQILQGMLFPKFTEIRFRSDHLMNEAPRSSANIDTIRCGIACKTPSDLRKAYEAVSAEFGGPVRVKNGYSKSFDPNLSFHYRNLLVNYKFHTGMKYCDMIKDSAINFAWDLFAAKICNEKVMRVQQFDQMCSEGNTWRLLDWFQDPAICYQEVVIMVEVYIFNPLVERGFLFESIFCFCVSYTQVQFMLFHYFDMRSHTHLLYKVVRPKTWADLTLDCLPDNVEQVISEAR